MQGIILLVFTGAFVYLVRKLLSFLKALQAIQYVRDPMADPVLLSTTGGALPQVRWVSYGSNTLFEEKHQPFKSAGWDIYSLVTISRYPNVSKVKFVADATAIKFAETEGTAVLAMLVSQYKITIKEESQFAGRRLKKGNQEFYLVVGVRH